MFKPLFIQLAHFPRRERKETMNLIEWNIRHGGSKRIPDIVNSIDQHHADLVVLTEYRSDYLADLKQGLKKIGLPHIITTNPLPKVNGILVASREPQTSLPSPLAPNGLEHRWLELSLPEIQARLLCVHIPTAGDKGGKLAFWNALNEYARDLRDERALIVGDFNTGLPIDAEGTPFVYSEKMAELLDIGWIDTWRQRYPDGKEYTWYSNANKGFRLDYAFASPKMKGAVREVSYSHRVREEGHSDHSMLVVRLE
jgi:exonuclease III